MLLRNLDHISIRVVSVFAMARMNCKCCGGEVRRGEKVVSLELCMGTFDDNAIVNYIPSMLFISHMDCWAKLNLQGVSFMKKAEEGKI